MPFRPQQSALSDTLTATNYAKTKITAWAVVGCLNWAMSNLRGTSRCGLS